MDERLKAEYPATEMTSSNVFGPSPASLIERCLRWGTQILGCALIVIGVYWAFHVFSVVLQAVRDPNSLQPAVTSMAQLIDAEQLVLTLGTEKIALGKPLAVAGLLPWYAIAAWIALAILTAGGKLVSAVSHERREFLAAMKEFLATTRPPGRSL